MSRRKPVVIDDDFYGQPEATIEPLRLADLKLKVVGNTAHFEQLNFKGAPNYSPLGKKIKGVDYIPAGREDFVRDVYRILKPDYNTTRKGHFEELKRYIRWLDNNDLTSIGGDYFHPDLYKAYMTYHQAKCNNGEQKLSSWASVKKMLSFFLRKKNREIEAKKLKSIKGIKRETEPHKGIDPDGEFKPLVRLFISAFGKFRKHIDEGTIPDVHPFWDEELFNQTAERKGWAKGLKSRKKVAFKSALKLKYTTAHNTVHSPLYNHFSRLAAMLTFCFTGQNTTSILNLRFEDLRFEAKYNGKVYFDLEKARADYLKLDTSIGFHKKAQEFFHQWLEISIKLQKDKGTDWLFPYFTESGEVKGFVESGQRAPQTRINNLTSSLGLVHITPSTLRQTKIDALMKVTQDIWKVAMSANNSVKTICVSYSDGNENDHKNGLAASNEAMYDFVKNGTDIHESANQAKFNHADVLSDYDYKRLRKQERENDKQTPVGTRCKDSTQGVANTIKKNLEKMGIEQSEEVVCTDFLGCFECEHHRLVAEVEDIWLMMSFSDTLKEMKDYPAINSMPTEKFHKLCSTIESILKRFSEVSPENYAEASEKQKETPHPLYCDGYSLVDLLEAF
ncbi:hypothetical protein [Vibrio parahaemolyticus]|uniref:hypothetical protein n=1 Tax=Vibrio parahaemolyticus TaxID=670 RepID=UPI0024BD08DB|nr:hypothetical protein [Vibrio parahaemolyticus]WHT04834.1 hypothetical protein O2T11_23065 [Vibrio parahaemolyticus]